MLTRAVRRRQTIRYLQDVVNEIQLPFLCPTLARIPPRTSQQQQRTVTTRPKAVQIRSNNDRRPQARRLASAAPIPESFDRNDEYSNYHPMHQHQPPASTDSTLSSLRQFDLSDIIEIDRTTATNLERLSSNLRVGMDIRGNVTEVERNLEACLLLKNWPRSMAGLRQLDILYDTNPEALRYQYNKALAFMVDDLMEIRSTEIEERVSQWIDREMKYAGLDPDALTFALVIRSALITPNRSKRDRTVRRYWDMARRFGLQGEVASLRNILSEQHLGLISEVCPLEAEDLEQYRQYTSSDDSPIMVDENVISQAPEVAVREMDQKGMGMKALRETLSLFSDAADKTQLLSQSTQEKREEYSRFRQSRLEKDAIDSAVGRWQSEHEKLNKMGLGTPLAHGHVGALLWQWQQIFAQKISKEIEKVREAEAKPTKLPQDRLRLEYGPFLEQLSADKIAATTLIGAIQLMCKVGVSKPVKLVKMVTELGKAVELEHQAERFQQKARRKEERGSALSDSLPAPPPDNRPVVHAKAGKLAQRNFHPAARSFMYHSEWTTEIQAKLGAILCELMFESALLKVKETNSETGEEILVSRPIFSREMLYWNGRRSGVVCFHHEFAEMMSWVPAGDTIAKQLPMICKPRPWTGYFEGGYLETDQQVLRTKNAETLQKDYTVAAAERGDLDQIFAGLNILGETGWKINRPVFDVMVQAWNTGDSIADLAPLHRDDSRPSRPPPEAKPFEKYAWYKMMRDMDNTKSGDHSNRCFQNFQIEIAKAYLDETFYLPHNMDFRGRAYPLPPYLNQMGADNARGLLLFSKGRELGEHGLRWLKIHASNLFGYDKASLTDRAQFPLDHLDDIRDSVANPLTGRKWWLKAECPWQFLSACHELVNALDSPNPTKFVSQLPIHQDGSCNGLQHYAALGGDIAGAKQVNLEPGDKPSDVYTGVAELVKAEIAADAAKGDEWGKLLEGRVTRKVVKQTVMTNVYGVTFLGAIRQVRKQIEDLMPDLHESRQAGKASTYIATKIFKALGTLFTGAHNIQYWLGDCANRISSSVSPAQLEEIWESSLISSRPEGEPKRKGRVVNKPRQPKTLDPAIFRSSVVWTTPLKLPVVQPYRVNKGRRVITNIQHITLREPSAADGVDKRKQLQAFPPNFIHSLDATHMLLSALKANEMGLSFAAVHDSFWTHAADVDTLNTLLRDAFIRMHSEDIIKRLAAEFGKRYEGHLYLAKVEKGSATGQAIQAYRKQLCIDNNLPRAEKSANVARHRWAELVREVEKRKLLASEDVEERQRGEEMVTAGSIFADMDGQKDIHSLDSFGATNLGSVPSGSEEAIVKEALEKGDAAMDGDVDLERTLEVGADGSMGTAVADFDADAELVGDAEVDSSAEKGIKSTSSVTVKPKKAANSLTWLWLPLEFRPLPKRGSFDVRNVGKSQYFFS